MGMSNEINYGRPIGQEQQHLVCEVDGDPMHLQSSILEFVTDIKEHDVLLGRGKSNATHIGNVLFQGKAAKDLSCPF
jgi:hypothetical protein